LPMLLVPLSRLRERGHPPLLIYPTPPPLKAGRSFLLTQVHPVLYGETTHHAV
jgi:hypothetical protein